MFASCRSHAGAACFVFFVNVHKSANGTRARLTSYPVAVFFLRRHPQWQRFLADVLTAGIGRVPCVTPSAAPGRAALTAGVTKCRVCSPLTMVISAPLLRTLRNCEGLCGRSSVCVRRIAGAHTDVFISQFNEYYRRKTLVFHFYFPANSCGNSDVLHLFSTFNIWRSWDWCQGVSDNCVSEAVQEYLKALIRFVLFFSKEWP